MKNWKLILAVGALAGALPILWGHGAEPKQDPKKVEELMRCKLTASQKVLEGVAIADFDMISKHAAELMRVSKEAEWKVVQTPMYEVFSNDFRRNAETLIQKAEEKNLDGAALAYMELTMSCVKCHKHVREVRMTRRD